MSRLTAITVIGILVIDLSYLLAISTAVADHNGLSCHNMSGYDLSTINDKTYKYIHNYTNTSTNKTDSFDVLINICRVFDTKDKTPEVCIGRQICGHKTTDKTPIGYRLKSTDFVPDNGSHKEYIKVVYDGSECDIHRILNYTMTINFYCGEDTPNFNHEISTTCGIELNYTTKSVCKTTTNNSITTTTSTPAPIVEKKKTVHCIWENGSHHMDLNQLVMTNGNHLTVGLSPSTSQHVIYYINVCRPLNRIFETFSHSSINNCGPNAAICRVTIGSNDSVLSLGEPTSGPIRLFDDSLNLFYENGSPCPARPHEKLRTRIKFVCDPLAGIENMIVNEPGSETMDAEDCAYFIEWRTSAVCNYIEPTKLVNNSCYFTDQRTGLSVDLTSLKKKSNNPYRIPMDNGSTFELNVCGLANSLNAHECYQTSACLQHNDSGMSYGRLTSSFFIYNGVDLTLRYADGSKCNEDINKTLSTEISFKCNPNETNSEPKFKTINSCVAQFEWQNSLICNIQPPKCAILSESGKYYNLRQLSSISHSWNTTDPKDSSSVYYLNVCSKVPKSIGCKDPNAGSCKCVYNSQKQLDCGISLGDPSIDELKILSNEDLLLTYSNGDDRECPQGMRAKTEITFKCDKHIGNPKFIDFSKPQCIYRFEWKTFMSCPVLDQRDELIYKDGFLEDNRLDAYINVSALMGTTFNVNEFRQLDNNKTDNYTYVINLSKPELSTDYQCSEAGVCQTKGDFRRDLGSVKTLKYYLRGHELQMALQSKGGTRGKCGKNANKNVTTIFRLHCSSSAGVGEPEFMYESNDCDYVFNWETSMVCPMNFLKQEEYIEYITERNKSQERMEKEELDHLAKSTEDNQQSGGHTNLWIGILIVICFVATVCALLFYKPNIRQVVWFKVRRVFKSDTTNHTFHYHQFNT
ncbi:cation-independent mannose-6-phosphate receptor-like isoform X3 [Oppia nitens]|uniref:cation-independent mannose-6-phosphate receptor-like isoform X3 n=1 Tax=Oppia nitens TaxID=1686743 RepID=UPI0023D9D878|nr:cation-independent mannose-6-phosphate receptor-like isoform X3 [Oppia nitens]